MIHESSSLFIPENQTGQIYPLTSSMPKQESKLELEQRAERIQTTIALLQAQKSEIEAAGVVAPPSCYIARYQACMS